MKTLKFTPELCAQILAGTKTSTWRLFDDKNLTIGDVLQFVNKENLTIIGTGEITGLRTKTMSTLEEADWAGHERFASKDELYTTYRGYYGEGVDESTEVKIITFNFSA